MQKNDVIIAKAEDYTAEGWTVVKPRGLPLFVEGLIKGEIAEIEITKLNKNYGYGKVLKIIEESEKRKEPLCKLADRCGGCQFQHIDYQEQLSIKDETLKSSFQRFYQENVEIASIEGMTGPFKYRNKEQIPMMVDSQGQLHSGFYQANSHLIVDMDYCFLQSDNCNQVYQLVKELLVEFSLFPQVRHILLRESFDNNRIMLVLVVKSFSLPQLDVLVEQLVAKCPMICSVQINLKEKDDNVILGEKLQLIYGDNYISERLFDCVFNISAKAFFQVNHNQCLKLYKKALDLAELDKNMTLLDLYCGIGTISILAAKQAKKVVGIEILAEAIEDAKLNSKINQTDNVEFYCGDAGQVAATLKEKVDVVFVDPPRKGLGLSTTAIIKKLNPHSVVYISCNPQTFISDIKDLAGDYELGKIYPFDMFPYTKHIEIVALLTKKRVD